MSVRFSKNIKALSFLVVTGLFILLGLSWHQNNQPASNADQAAIISPAAGTVDGQSANHSAVAGIELSGDFTLVNHHGETVTAADYDDSYKLVFFGFTYCPDICPAALQKMTSTLEMLGADSEQIKPLFISVDPARDTPEVLKDYLSLFHPRIIGLTGTEEQVAYAKEQYRVYAAKAPLENQPAAAAANDHANGHANDHGDHSGHDSHEGHADHSGHDNHSDHAGHNYMMDHSSFIYLMGPDNTLHAIFRTQDSPQKMAGDIRHALGRD